MIQSIIESRFSKLVKDVADALRLMRSTVERTEVREASRIELFRFGLVCSLRTNTLHDVLLGVPTVSLTWS